MPNVKYVQRRTRSDGTVVWSFNPPAYVREAITDHEIAYLQFESRQDAEDHAKMVSQMYQEVRRQEKSSLHIASGTVISLVASYKRTNAYISLSANTKRSYNQMLNGVFDIRLGKSSKTIGQMNAKHITPMIAEQIYTHLKDNISEHRANHSIKVLARVWGIAITKLLVRSNPFRNMGLRTLPSRTVLWEPEQVLHFIDHADSRGCWGIGTMALLCWDLCQRPGDMRQLTWGNYIDGAFDFVQEKTKVRMTIPASPRLVERLRGHLEAPDVIICRASTKTVGMDRHAAYKLCARIRKSAGLPDELRMSDLRRTGATEMAEAGCTEDELRATTGHRSRDVLASYVRPTRKLAAGGINKRFG